MSLTLLVAQEKWQEFDDAWSELILAEGPVEDLLAALRIAGEKKRLPRCLPMVRQHADLLASGGRAADAARLLGVALYGGGSPGELVQVLYENARSAWGEASWWSQYTEIAGLRPDNHDARKAWVLFERLLSFEPGKLVFHPGGWGVGEVIEIRLDAAEIDLRFTKGRTDRFPLNAAVEIFEPLAEEDLRALYFRDPERMKKRLKDDPLAVLRAIVERHNGRASTVGIKNALLQVGVEGSAWSGWWRKARKQAESSEWFRVTGTAAKGEVQLLHSATDPVEDLKKQLENSASLADLLTKVRDQLAGGKGDERMRGMMLDVLETSAGKVTEAGPVSLAAWLLLRDERSVSPPPLVELLKSAGSAPAPADTTTPPPLWVLFQSLPGAREQERCVDCLSEVFGESWLDEAVKNLQHAPPGMVRPLTEALFAAGRKEDLAAHYKELLARPLRAPDVLVALARLGEAGKLPGEFPPPVLRAQSLLALATYLFVNRKGDPQFARTQTRLVELLTKGKEPMLRRLLAQADHEALQSLQRTLQRGVDETVDNMFTEIAMRATPVGLRAAPPNFWEGDRIWTTRKGLDRRKAELHVLREVKIPANQDAIGRAASMGDLSENSEWEMAIEEQRTLTARAAEIETELRAIELIENAILPEHLVCPGTRVRYREKGSASEHEIAILGPWDTDQAEHVVSYRAPLAAGLLGKRAGDEARISLPSGSLDVVIVGVDTADLD